eukprot:3896719-Alexandrium_andersonii.AAC.1
MPPKLSVRAGAFRSRAFLAQICRIPAFLGQKSAPSAPQRAPSPEGQAWRFSSFSCPQNAEVPRFCAGGCSGRRHSE